MLMCSRMRHTVGYSVMNAIVFISAPHKRTQQRINLINLLDKGGPGEPGAAAEGLVIGGGHGGGAASGGEALIVRCGGKREAHARTHRHVSGNTVRRVPAEPGPP